MKSYRSSFQASWRFAITIALGVLLPFASPAMAGEQVRPLSELLNADGTVNLTTGFSGAVDVERYRMAVTDSGVPVFRADDKSTAEERGVGQCAWDTAFGGPAGVAGNFQRPLVLTLLADGSDLYAGGRFEALDGTTSYASARWDGTAWGPFGNTNTGFGSNVLAYASNGSDIYAVGALPGNGHVVKWNGADWAPVGTGVNAAVQAAAMMGTDLYVGGYFSTAGGNPASFVAKWDGSVWSALGSGTDGPVTALAVIGNDLYAGGQFGNAGGSPANNVAMWDGASWSPLGGGTSGMVLTLATDGTTLFAGGDFTLADGLPADYVAMWNGSSWSALGSGMDDRVNALVVDGADVYAGGNFATAGGVPAGYIAKWDGVSWSDLDGGMDEAVDSLALGDATLYAGGSFSIAGASAANGIAAWDGANWSSVSAGAAGAGTDQSISVLATDGTDLYAGGVFDTVGDLPANRIARWDGSSWSALGSGISADGPVTQSNHVGVTALAIDGTDLYVGGVFRYAGGVSANNIAKWDGTTWSALGSGVDGGLLPVIALAVGGGNVYAGGFLSTAGGSPASYIARWDGASWHPLGSGTNFIVESLLVDGTDVYAGGQFTEAGGSPATYIAKWDGSNWSALGAGVNLNVWAMAKIGSDLYAAGNFTQAGGAPAGHIAKWDGTNWSTVGSGLPTGVFALAVDGSTLYASTGYPGYRIYRWNGSSWLDMPGTFGVDPTRGLALFDNSLYAGGEFTEIDGGTPSFHIARFDFDNEPFCPTTTTTLPPIDECPPTPVPGCSRAETSKLQIKNGTPEKDQIVWKWSHGDDTTLEALGSPLQTTRYFLCFYDAQLMVSSLVHELTIEPGPAWESKSDRGYLYTDKAGSQGGVQKVQLKSGPAWKASAQLKAKGLNLTLPTPAGGGLYFNSDPDVVVQLLSSEGTCMSAELSSPKSNTEELYKATERYLH